LNEREAKEKGVPYRLCAVLMCDAAYPIESGENDGLLKVLVDPHTRQLLGVSA
jgi:pyruvate/2-oxoglutarate dehydrogenase complex dihydrolipoamide dehydrogenase (E3) component